MKIYDLLQIKRAIDLGQDLDILINDQKQSLIDFSAGLYETPLPMQLSFGQTIGDCHIKAGFKNDDDFFIVKIATGFYQNTITGLASGDGAILIFSQRTGLLQTIFLDGGFLTTLRTALAAAAVVKITPWKTQCIGIVGTGKLAVQVIDIFKMLYPETNFCIWGRSFTKARSIAPHKFHVCKSIEQLTKQADVVITTTASTKPIITEIISSERQHIIAIGADDLNKQECDPYLFRKADAIIVDSKAHALQFGDTFHAIKEGVITSDKIFEFGSISQNQLALKAEYIITDLTGISAQDVVISKFVMHKLMTTDPV